MTSENAIRVTRWGTGAEVWEIKVPKDLRAQHLFLKSLKEGTQKSKKLSLSLWNERGKVLDINILPDSKIGFDNANKTIWGVSAEGGYSFNIPYGIIKIIYVNITRYHRSGKKKKD